MKLKATDPEAQKVKAVLLNGKPVPNVHEFDDEAGWVTSYLPVLPTRVVAGKVGKEEKDVPECEMELVKREGKVEVVWVS